MTDSVNELALRDTYRLLELEGVDILKVIEATDCVYGYSFAVCSHRGITVASTVVRTLGSLRI